MLAVYTFVFSQVFKARWGGLEQAGPLGFAINLFAGLIVFNLFSECVTRAPSLILGNPSYVKKVIFPLDVLGMVSVGNAAFHAAISMMALVMFELIALQRVPLTILWLPLVCLPLLMGTLACTWLLSAAGVFIRDLSQLISTLINMLMFLSPIFFPISSLPPKWQPLLNINPIAQVIEQVRRVVVNGQCPSIAYLITGMVVGLFACELSHRLFEKSRRAFADVL
jgi:lipopolysaccharide transport system permease protein